MDDAVNAPVGRRERKTRETRRRMLEAADMLFARDGYTATTIDAIAATADVAVQTVYAVFGNKRAILVELLERAVGGDDEGTPLTDRTEWQAMEAEPDPRRQLQLLAAIATRIASRMAALYGVLAAASGADKAIADMFKRTQDARYRDQQRVARVLARNNALKSGLSQKRATDIIWAVANPNMFRALVGERRWAVSEYERWLADMLASALLADPHSLRRSAGTFREEPR